eukprot:jgi/Chrzof1/2113/Cz11g03030.t1
MKRLLEKLLRDTLAGSEIKGRGNNRSVAIKTPNEARQDAEFLTILAFLPFGNKQKIKPMCGAFKRAVEEGFPDWAVLDLSQVPPGTNIAEK